MAAPTHMSDLQQGLEALVQVVTRNVSDHFVIPSETYTEFVELDDGTIQLPTLTRPNYKRVASALMPDYPTSEAFARAADLVANRIEAEPADWRIRSALDAFLSAYFEHAGQVAWNESAFERSATSFEQLLGAAEVDLRLMAPIRGLSDESGEIAVTPLCRLFEPVSASAATAATTKTSQSATARQDRRALQRPIAAGEIERFMPRSFRDRRPHE
jgi:hypothetical protein